MGNETFYSDGLNLSNKKIQPDFVFIFAIQSKRYVKILAEFYKT